MWCFLLSRFWRLWVLFQGIFKYLLELYHSQDRVFPEIMRLLLLIFFINLETITPFVRNVECAHEWAMTVRKHGLSDLWVSKYGLRRSAINAIQITTEQLYKIHFSPRTPNPAYITYNMQNLLSFIDFRLPLRKGFFNTLLLSIMLKDLVSTSTHLWISWCSSCFCSNTTTSP